MNGSTLIQQAQQLLDKGKPKQAWQLLSDTPLNQADANFLYFRAFSASQCGEIQDAKDALEACLNEAPEHPGAHLQLGVLAQSAGDSTAAIAYFKQATKYAPNWADAHYNLGVLQAQQGDTAAAEASYQSAMKANPKLAQAANNLANIFIERGAVKEAGDLLQTALKQNPYFAEGWCSLGRVLLAQSKLDLAAKALERAIAVQKQFPAAWENLGDVRNRQEQKEAALAAYEQALEYTPDNEQISFKCALLRGETPAKAPDTFVRHLFNSMAKEFDTRLVDTLGYNLPFELDQHLDNLWIQPGHMNILDLGCGTGLVGQQVKPWAKHLAGIDLSPRMLAAAAQRQCYDELIEASLQPWLEQTTKNNWDLVIAADVFIYFGELKPLLNAIKSVLLPQGRILFSIELHDGNEDYILRPTGRYAHTEASIRELAKDCGLAVEHAEKIPLRREQNIMIEGMVIRLGGPGH